MQRPTSRKEKKRKGTPGGVTYGTETGLRPVLYHQKSVKVGVDGGPEGQKHESDLGYSPGVFAVSQYKKQILLYEHASAGAEA